MRARSNIWGYYSRVGRELERWGKKRANMPIMAVMEAAISIKNRARFVATDTVLASGANACS